jgi:hypothetical protein
LAPQKHGHVFKRPSLGSMNSNPARQMSRIGDVHFTPPSFPKQQNDEVESPFKLWNAINLDFQMHQLPTTLEMVNAICQLLLQEKSKPKEDEELPYNLTLD